MSEDSFEGKDLLQRLGQYLLALDEGQQILSTREMSELFRVSTGSISAAMNHLEEVGAVTLNRRGWLGSFLEKKSIGLLWKVTENSPLVIALTLPSYPKCEGLATAFFTLCERAGIEIYLIFIRGSYHRIKALRNGRCHAAVMSVLAAEELCGEDEEILLRLPPQSFVTDHRVFYRRNKKDSCQPLKVGIDLDSFDIKYLTELEFAGQEVQFEQITFIQSDLHLEKSPVDAAISNLDHLARLKNSRIVSRPLSVRVQALIGDRDTCAAVVTRTADKVTRTILKMILQPAEIIDIQQKVVDGLIVPQY